MVWEQYESPGERAQEPPLSGVPPTRRAPKDPGLPGSRPSPETFTGGRGVYAGGARSHGAGVAIGLVGMLAVIGVGVAVASSSENASPQQRDYSGFYDCVADEEAKGENTLLSPADLCEIGNERPPDYVDDHEYDLFGDTEDNGYFDDEY